MALKNSSRFGVKMNDVTSVRDKLARLLDMEFKGVQSDQWGLYYVTVGKGIREIGIHYNLYPATAWDEEEEVIEEEYSDYPVLISIYNATNLDFYDKLFIEDPEFQGVLIEREIDEDGD